MNKKLLAAAIILASSIIAIVIRAQTRVDTQVFEKFPLQEPTLSQSSILPFSTISTAKDIPIEELPPEILALIPASSTSMSIQAVQYTDDASGYLIFGSFPWTGAPTFLRTYSNQLLPKGWIMSSGAYNNTAMTSEHETLEWKMKLVVLDLSTGTARFGIGIQSK